MLTYEGRPWRWPVNGGAKAVKKEKLFERQELELWLQILVTEKFRSMASGSGASFFLLGFWGFVNRSATGAAKEFCYFCSSKVGRRQAGMTGGHVRCRRSFKRQKGVNKISYILNTLPPRARRSTYLEPVAPPPRPCASQLPGKGFKYERYLCREQPP